MKSTGRSRYSAPLSLFSKTSSGFSQDEPIAIWNGARGVWETPRISLFCEHSEPYSETLPRSGTMRSGRLYERPMSEPRTEGNECSSSPLMGTPTSRDYKGVPGKNVQMASLPRDISLLPTPVAGAQANRMTRRYPSHENGTHGLSLASEVGELALLPTPNTLDNMPPKTREQIQAHRDDGKGGDRNLREAVLYELENFPEGNSAYVEWGRYEPAVRRWEAILGRPAPYPTEPTKTGQRLSPRFSEWVMGLPDGWVTDIDISREGQLKAIGNGVVPQQAALALRILLARAKENT